ncbi:MAG: hypothetical protein OHK0029_11840 [Armatimonadaceae bacterium]
MPQVDWLATTLERGETDPAFDPQVLEAWRKNTEPDEAANLLLRVLHQYPVSFLQRQLVLLVLIGAALWLVVMACWGFHYALPVALVTALVAQRVTNTITLNNRVVRRAALLLAGLNDERSLPYLLETWSPIPGQEATAPLVRHTERELLRLTDAALLNGAQPRIAASFRHLLHRTVFRDLQQHRQRVGASFPEWTEDQTDILLGAIRYLAVHHSEEDRVILHAIARAYPATPNRRILCEAAQAALAQPVPVAVSVQAVLPTEREAVLPAVSPLRIDQKRQ